MSNNQVRSITDTLSYVYFNRSGKPATAEVVVGSWLYTNDSLKIVYAEKIPKHTLDYLEIGNIRVPMTDVDGKGITFTGTLPALNTSGKVDVIVHDKLIGASSTPATPTTPKATITSLKLTNCFANVNEGDKIDIGSTITFTPDTGYELTEDGSVKIYNEYGMSHNETISKDTGTYKVPDDTNKISFTMNATKKADTPKATIIGLNLTNCFTNYKLHDTVDIGSTITFTPNSGCEFTQDGTVKIYNEYGMSHNETISKDTGTYKVPDDTNKISFTMNATKKADTPKATIIGLNLTNCFTNYKLHDTVEIGSTITFTPNSGCEFTENGTVTVYNEYGMSHDEPISKDTGTYKVPDDTDKLSITMSATKKVVVPKAKITDLHLTNCIASVNGVVINLHDEIDVGSTITVKANKNFKFTSNGSSSLTNTDGVAYHKPIVIDPTDKTIATLVIEDNVNTVGLEMNAIENTPVPETSGGFINTYVVDNTILNELSKNRFTYKDNGTGGASPVTVIDNATMITSLLHIPYSVESITGSDNDIILGNHNTKVLAPRLTDNVLHVDFGTIKVDELNKDNSDYQNTDCKLYVPYSTPIKLDSENIINKSIHIIYVIDVYSGSGKIVLSDDDSIVGSYNVDVGSEIPFVQSTNNSHVSNLKMSISNMITRPYIRVKYYNRLDNTYNSNRLALVSDMKGFIQVNNILKIDSDNIDSESFNEIKNELSTGIII